MIQELVHMPPQQQDVGVVLGRAGCQRGVLHYLADMSGQREGGCC